jgi:transcriptional regulator with XRE-family HTH domain
MHSFQVNGAKVLELRNSKGWTQADLADRSNLSDKTIVNMEASQRIRRDSIAKVAAPFGVSVESLIAAVPQAADKGSISASVPDPRPPTFCEWPYSQLVQLLHRVERNNDESEDVRIVTTAFSGSVTDLQLTDLLEKDIRIKILLMNPDNKLLMIARHGKRTDESPESAYEVVKGQIKLLEFTNAALAESGDSHGELEWRLSNAMPFTFVIHTSKWAIVALFLAKHTLSLGPLLEVSRDTALWKTLRDDWLERWEDADSRRKQKFPRLVLQHAPVGFEEFFGDDAFTRSNDGVIILQSDPIEKLLQQFVFDLGEQIKSVPEHRLYKARTWINRWDTDGAAAIQEQFQKYKISAPRLLLSEHHSHDEIPPSAPFQIAMGLGFTFRTQLFVETCSPWMRVTREPESGDAVSIHMDLMAKGRLTRFSDPVKSEEKGFVRLLPLHWDTKYLDRWLDGATGQNVADVQDYALIFRHTHNDDPRQISFVLAGFTERGTAIAGRYLAKRWQELWRKYVADTVNGPSRGDFFIMIAGPSWPGSVDGWKEDPNFLAITPERLRGKIDCEWARRFD